MSVDNLSEDTLEESIRMDLQYKSHSFHTCEESSVSPPENDDICCMDHHPASPAIQ